MLSFSNSIMANWHDRTCGMSVWATSSPRTGFKVVLTGRRCLRPRHQKSPCRSVHLQIKLRTKSVRTLVVLVTGTSVGWGWGKRGEGTLAVFPITVTSLFLACRLFLGWRAKSLLLVFQIIVNWIVCPSSLYCGPNSGAWYLELGLWGSNYVEVKSWPSWLLPWLPLKWWGIHFCSFIHAVRGTVSHWFLWPPPSWIQLARSRKCKNAVSLLNR